MLTLKQTLVESITNSQAIRFNSIPKSYFPSLNTVPYATEQFDGLFDIFRGKQFLFHFYCLRRYNPILLCAFLTMHREILKALSRKRLLPISNSDGNSFHFWSCRKTSASGEVQCFLCAGLGCMTVTEYVGAFELRDQKRLSSHMFKRTGSKKLLKSIITLLSEPSCGTNTTIIQILLSNSQPTLLLTGCVFEIYLLLRLTIKSTHWQSNSFKFQTCTKPRTVITSTLSPVEKWSMSPPLVYSVQETLSVPHRCQINPQNNNPQIWGPMSTWAEIEMGRICSQRERMPSLQCSLYDRLPHVSQGPRRVERKSHYSLGKDTSKSCWFTQAAGEGWALSVNWEWADWSLSCLGHWEPRTNGILRSQFLAARRPPPPDLRKKKCLHTESDR